MSRGWMARKKQPTGPGPMPGQCWTRWWTRLRTRWSTRWLTLLWWSSTGHRARLLRSGLGVLVGVALTICAWSFGQLGRQAFTRIALGDAIQLRVRAPSFTLGPLDLVGTLLKPRRIDDATLRQLKARPEVARGWLEVWSRFPVGIQASVMGQRIYTDAALLGLPPEAVKGDVTRAWHWQPGQVVPVLAPRSLLALYNSSFGPSHGLPRISSQAAVGLSGSLVAGRSSFSRGESQTVVLEGEVVGLSAYGGALAAIVPLEVVRHLEQELGTSDAGSASAAVIELKPGTDPAPVQRALQDAGWTVEDPAGMLRHLATLLRAVQWISVAVGLLWSLTALLLMTQLYGIVLEQRRLELRALRTLGVTGKELRRMLSLEVLGLSACATLPGQLLGLALVSLLAPIAQTSLEQAVGLELELDMPLAWDNLGLILLVVPLLALLMVRRGIRRVTRDAA